ncbi:elongation factor G [Halanaerobium kushneri]|uniref:Translation elongation factor 2 (EF-2/EF-G) n=1 Tax=Halanaerobium kushneri TaxID=56779 RepID=A0A1N6XAB5_9FIRM|nr:elongation factor G [Halanaerobium kushneri]RCW62037.1 translation elongation factor 2 (EF-2/EF-G) [Halanaerobium sp. ST460_2HS_T2]SIQ99191.1 translation elongation factor 2 (EF-2/EF-G) [Halanaerobium kushneri]
MSKITSKDIRNFCFISHGGAGKSTLTEMLLYNAGVIDEPGSVDKGNSHSDFNAVEKEHKHSVHNSYFNFEWHNKLFHFIDTPGYADFRSEVISALRMVESAVLLVDAAAGIEVNTGYVWELADKNDLAKAVFINKVDKEDADFDRVVEELRSTYDDSFAIVTIPYYENGKFEGIIDLLDEKLYKNIDGELKSFPVPDSEKERVEDYELKLTEEIVELKEDLMIKYLDGEKITIKELTKAFEEEVAGEELVPVFAGSALQNCGVAKFLDDLTRIFPSASEVHSDHLVKSGEVLSPEPESKFSAQVCKTMVDPYIGKLSIFRIFSGKLERDDMIYIPNIDEEIKVTKLYKLNGKDQDNVDDLTAGEIGAVAKLDELVTSYTMRDPETDIYYHELEFPKPMYSRAAYPADGIDEEKMASALQRYSDSDPTFKVNYNKVTKELICDGMGTIHFIMIKEECQRKYDVDFTTQEPKVAYRETIQKKADVEEKYKKQSGGRGQYGHVLMRVEPLPRGRGFEFEEEIFGGAIPGQYIPAVEKGIVDAKEEGALAGYPVVDFKVVLYDGSYHDVDSSEMAFKIASSKAFRKALEQARSVLLEPIMSVKVTVPQDFMGDIMGDFNSRRGRIEGMDPQDGVQIIKAKVPQAEMFNYAVELKSITGGYGSFDMEFSHYDKVPGDISDKIIEQVKREKS